MGNRVQPSQRQAPRVGPPLNLNSSSFDVVGQSGEAADMAVALHVSLSSEPATPVNDAHFQPRRLPLESELAVTRPLSEL